MAFSSGWFQTQSGRQGLMGSIIQQQGIRICDPSVCGACQQVFSNSGMSLKEDSGDVIRRVG
jgi:hypothetical protein